MEITGKAHLVKEAIEQGTGFSSRIQKKFEQVEESWQALEQEWNHQNLVELHRHVHQFYRLCNIENLVPLGLLADKAATFLFSLLENEGVLSSGQYFYLVSSMNSLRQGVENYKNAPSRRSSDTAEIHQSPQNREVPKVELKPSLQPVQPDTNPLVVLFSSGSREENGKLALQLSHFGYRIELVGDLAAFEKGLAEESPAAIIIGAEPDHPVKTILAHIEEKQHIPLIFLSNRNDVRARLDAVKTGGDAFLTNPPNLRELIDQLDSLTTPSLTQAYRVLVVDDSPTTVRYYSSILENAGILTQIVTDPLQIMQPLVEFAPDLILMDMYMPDCTGLELAAVIRQQPGYIGVPIVFLSAETDLQKQLRAMKLGGDDFLTKDIGGEHLVSVVTARAERSRNLRSFIERDSLTGLFNHARTREQLELEVARARRRGSELVLAMLDLDHFKRVNDTYGHPTGDRVIKNLARLLLQRLRKTDVIGRYGGEEFAVILPDTNAVDGKKVLEELRGRFGQFRHYAEGEEFFCSFSCGLAAFPAHGEAEALSQAADQALYLAKRGGRNRVEVANQG